MASADQSSVFWTPWDPYPFRLLCPTDSPSRVLVVAFSLQGDFPDPGVGPPSLASPCIGRWILYHLNRLGSPCHAWCLLFSLPWVILPRDASTYPPPPSSRSSPAPHDQLPLWQLQLSRLLQGLDLFCSVREQESFCHFFDPLVLQRWNLGQAFGILFDFYLCACL